MFNSLRNPAFTLYQRELERAVGDSGSLLDIGCGDNSPIRSFSSRLHSIGVDTFEPSLEKSRRRRIHNEYLCARVEDIGKHFQSRSIDCVLALDLIEHLPKEAGLSLIQTMERIARKRVILYTPNGFLPQGEYDNNPWQVHQSGWEVEELQSLGYQVLGINGWKPLRTEYANLRFRPKVLWGGVSYLSQFFVRNRPRYAFQLLCVKNIESTA